MFNNKLQYMMSNNPDDTISKKGSEIRKKIRPMFIKLLKIGNKLNLIVENKRDEKNDRPIIYVASHGFKDDVLNTILTLNDDAYVVFGNIDLFFNTFDGLCLWIYGTQLVNRYDKESKHAMKEKMNRIISLGNNIIIFSEATWNLSPNKLMENLHWGFYDVAEKNNALIVPIVTHKVGKKCYSNVLETVDIKNITAEDLNDTLKLMKKYIFKAKNMMIYDDSKSLRIKKYIDELNDFIEEIQNKEQKTLLNSEIDKIALLAKKSSDFVKKLKEELETSDYLKESTYNIIIMLLKRISNAKKEIIVLKIRDYMATAKYEMYEKHPDYSYMKNGRDIYDAWDDYIQDTISATPYFYPELEEQTLYKDPLQSTEIDVMPWLNEKRIKLKKQK